MSSFSFLLACLALSSLAILGDASYIKYTTVTGYFLQDLNSTNATSFDYTAVNFGLINQTYDTDTKYTLNHMTQWQRFDIQVSKLNRHTAPNVQYKVLFMGRHGEGYHNAAETFYGTPAWNCYWAEIDGNATVVWSDAHLTPKGIAQAQIANNFWRKELAVQHIHAPDSYYTSPLSRCLETANVTFSGLDLPKSHPFIPLIKEFFRESIDIHTCDRRSNKTYIHEMFPAWPFEPGFTEYDELYNGVTAETDSAQNARSKIALDSVFSTDSGVYISITSHSGEIGSLLEVLGHRSFSLNTGAVIPVLVKAETIGGPAPATTIQPYTVSAHCTSPPITSISNGACVCASSAAPVTTTLAGSGP